VTSVAVASDQSNPIYGQNMKFTATVTSSSPGATTPTGTVSFVIDGTTVASGVSLDGSGKATFSTSSLATPLTASGSPHTVTVNYTNIDGLFGNSSGSLAGGQTVQKASTTVTLTTPSLSPVINHSVTFTATVNPVSPGAGNRTGTVTFSINGTPQATVGLNGS